LGQLQTIEKDLKALGYQIIAVTTDRPEELKKSVQKHELTYELLSDSSMAGAKALGIAFKVDDGTLKKLVGYGIDIEAASGETHHLLPVPSVFIVGQDGIIDFSYVNPDHSVRLNADLLLAVAKTALKD